MLNISDCTVTCQDGVPFEKLKHAQVIHNGSRATVFVRRPGERKLTQVERIIGAQVLEDGDGWTIQGTSLTLRDEYGLSKADSAITLRIQGKAGCVTC